MIVLLSIPPAMEGISIAAASPVVATRAARVARGALPVGVVAAFALVTASSATKRTPPARPADRRAPRGRTSGA